MVGGGRGSGLAPDAELASTQCPIHRPFSHATSFGAVATGKARNLVLKCAVEYEYRNLRSTRIVRIQTLQFHSASGRAHSHRKLQALARYISVALVPVSMTVLLAFAWLCASALGLSVPVVILAPASPHQRRDIALSRKACRLPRISMCLARCIDGNDSGGLCFLCLESLLAGFANGPARTTAELQTAEMSLARACIHAYRPCTPTDRSQLGVFLAGFLCRSCQLMY